MGELYNVSTLTYLLITDVSATGIAEEEADIYSACTRNRSFVRISPDCLLRNASVNFNNNRAKVVILMNFYSDSDWFKDKEALGEPSRV